MDAAVRSGNLKRVQELVRSGEDVNKPVFEDGSLLILAIRCGHKDIALALLSSGANVHTENKGGWTALHWACYNKGFEEVVQALINRGCRMNSRDSLGRTPLMLAEQRGKEAISMCSLQAAKEQMDSLIHLACRRGDLSAVRTFLNNGGILSISREEQEKLLHLVCREGDAFIAHTLLKNDCSVSILSRKEQEQLLHLACDRGDAFVVRILLENGCRVSILSGKEQEELLHLACSEGDVFIAHTLLKNACSVSILSREEQEKLLHLACDRDDTFIAHTLLENGCRVSILSREEQEKLLHLACRESDAFIAHTLLKNGCRVSILSREEQEKLLHRACHWCYVFVVRTLLENGCRVSILFREEQEKLLHLACHWGDAFVVHTLLENGCRVSILSREEQEKLLHLACHEADVFIAHTLLKNDCSVSILSREEQEKLLHLACDRDDTFVVRTLLENGCRVSILSREEQEKLLHLAYCEANVFVAHTLLKNGCRVSILSREEQEKLLHLACDRGDAFVVRTLLENGCRVSILSREEQEKLLHLACHWGDAFVVHTLLENDCRVSILSREEQEKLLHLACREDDVFIGHTLLKNDCSVSILSREEQEKLLHLACHWGDAFVVCTLLENGCSISILFSEEQEKLLHLVCREDDAFIAHTLLKNGCSVSILSREEQEKLLHLACHEDDVFIAHTLLKNDCSVSILSREEQEKLLCCACLKGDVLVVEALLANGCNMNCLDLNGCTPLMVATEKGHEEVVKKLILAGANLRMQNPNSDTALHIAATRDRIQCGILLAEGGVSVRTKNRSSQTPLDLAGAEFKEAIKQALSFTTRKALCIIGNSESGKSTLIAALQAESNSFLGRIFNRFRRVSDHRQRTAGIETVAHCSQRYGEVLFFDFAGQDDYHGPHQMFLESFLSKPGISMTLLLVVKTTEEEDAILHQLHRWLSPVALMANPASPPHVIIIGSFLDKVRSKDEATARLTRCVEATRNDLDMLPLEFVGSSFLNCRQPQSNGIDQICKFLQEIPIPEFRATHTRYSLAWVLSQIRLSNLAQAVQLHEFSVWVQDNKDNLPRTIPPPEEVCQDLSAAGHALYLPNKEDPSKSWLVLDLPSILHDVYGTLFSQFGVVVNEFGLLHCRHLAKLFQHLDLEMVKQLLVSLEFCLPVDPSILKVDLSKLTQSEEASGWLFFPALISAKHPHPTSECLPQESVHYLCWQLKTVQKHSISARLLQTILLRLAAHFVVKHHLSEGVQQQCCSIWWNGIAWQSKKGVDITVHITNNRVIQVIGASMASSDKSCQYMIEVISDILSTVHQLSPNLAADSYVVHRPKMAALYEDVTTVPHQELFPVTDIQNSIKYNEEFSLSLKDSNIDRSTRAAVSDLFGGCTPSLEDIGRINWPQLEPSQTQSPTGPNQPDVLSWTVSSESML